MMDKNLQWTEQLGDAFLANQAAVSQSIQTLRAQAQAAGNLQSTPQQTVTGEPGTIEMHVKSGQTFGPRRGEFPASSPDMRPGNTGRTATAEFAAKFQQAVPVCGAVLRKSILIFARKAETHSTRTQFLYAAPGVRLK